MPGLRTVYDWEKSKEGVSARIAQARLSGEEMIALDCLNIADDNGRDTRILESGIEVVDSDWIQRSKLRIETRLKLLAKWNPRKWGDKVDVTTDGKSFAAPVIVAPVADK